MSKFNPMSLDKVALFLIDKFKKMDIVTEFSDWQHMHTFGEEKDYNHTFYHDSIGYHYVIESNETLNSVVNIIDLFRLVTAISDDLPLIKNLFAQLMKEHNNPNVGYELNNIHNLTSATMYGNLDIITYLVDNGMHIHVKNEANVITALKYEKYDVVTYFLEKDPNINQDVIFNSDEVNEEMINFIKKYNLHKKLNSNTSNKHAVETKCKI